jgi:hypothetical protein
MIHTGRSGRPLDRLGTVGGVSIPDGPARDPKANGIFRVTMATLLWVAIVAALAVASFMYFWMGFGASREAAREAASSFNLAFGALLALRSTGTWSRGPRVA